MPAFVLFVRVGLECAGPRAGQGPVPLEVERMAKVQDIITDLRRAGAVQGEVELKWQGRRLANTDLLLDLGISAQSTVSVTRREGGPRSGEKKEVGGTNDEDRGRPDPYLTLYRQAPLSRVSRRHRVHDGMAPRAAQEWGGWLVEQLRPQRKEEAARAAPLVQVPAEVTRAIARTEAEPPSKGPAPVACPSADQTEARVASVAEGDTDRRPVTPQVQPRRRIKNIKRAATPSVGSRAPVCQEPALPAVRIKRRITADALFDVPFDRALELYPELQSRLDTLTDGQRALWRIRWPERHPQLRELIDYWLPDIAPLERSRVNARPYSELFQEGVFLNRDLPSPSPCFPPGVPGY